MVLFYALDAYTLLWVLIEYTRNISVAIGNIAQRTMNLFDLCQIPGKEYCDVINNTNYYIVKQKGLLCYNFDEKFSKALENGHYDCD